MLTRLQKILLFPVLALLCLLAWNIPTQSTQAQMTPAERERVREDRAVHREVQRELREDEWRRHNERFFGPGVVIERSPAEAYDAYVLRIRARCDAQWQNCSALCTGLIDPVSRNLCMANCNNDLYECNAGY